MWLSFGIDSSRRGFVVTKHSYMYVIGNLSLCIVTKTIAQNAATGNQYIYKMLMMMMMMRLMTMQSGDDDEKDDGDDDEEA